MPKICFSCATSLENSQYCLKDGHSYCISCYEVRFCPTCTKCHQKIKSGQRSLNWKNTDWHNSCFNCTQCNKSLLHSSSHSENNQPHCSTCYQMKCAPKCNECGEIIEFGASCIDVDGNKLHTRCFKCSSCNLSVDHQSYYDHNGAAYCQKCDNEQFCPKCARCGAVIPRGIRYTKVDGQKLHTTCFTCSTCGQMIGSGFQTRDGHHYHPHCVDNSYVHVTTSYQFSPSTVQDEPNIETSLNFIPQIPKHAKASISPSVSEISEFYNACRDNNIDLVINKLKTMTAEEINQMEPNGSTALHVASHRGHEKIVELLLEKGASHSIVNRYKNTPLEEAKTDKIRKLIRGRMNETRFVSESVEWILPTNDADYQANKYLKKIETYGKDPHFDRLIIHIRDNYLEKLLKSVEDSDKIHEYFDMAIKRKDPLQLLIAYTADTGFYSALNIDLAKLHVDTLTDDENLDRAYYIGIIAHHPKLKRFSYIGTVFRGMIITNDDLKRYQVGTRILTKTFSSASKQRKVALRFLNEKLDRNGRLNTICIYQIRNERTALDIEEISEFKDEEEVLILPYSAFKILDIQRKNHNSPHIEITLKECEPW